MKKITFLLIILISVITFSCTESIDVKLDDTYTRLIVDASISTDTTIHKVILTKTASYFDSSNPLPVTGAIVTIEDGINTFLLTENILKPGVYETLPTVYGEVGKIYKLTIKNVDIDNNGTKEEYTSSTTINHFVKIDSIQTTRSTKRKAYDVNLYALDPPTNDYYMFEVYKNGILQTDTLREVFFTDDKLFNGNYTNGIAVGYLRDGKGSEKAYPGDTIAIELRSITKEFNQILWETLDATRPSIPLISGPPANVKGNISNGAIGFFYGYSVTRASCTIK